MLGPVDHVGGGPQQPVVHEESRRTLFVLVGDILRRGVMRGIEEECVAHDERRGIGRVFRLEDRHVHLLQASHLPPVEMERRVLVFPFDHKIQVVGAAGDGLQVHGQCLPSRGACRLQCAQGKALGIVEVERDDRGMASVGESCGEGAWSFVAEGHVFQPCIVAGVQVGRVGGCRVEFHGLYLA